jgi:hypothetical protein
MKRVVRWQQRWRRPGIKDCIGRHDPGTFFPVNVLVGNCGRHIDVGLLILPGVTSNDAHLSGWRIASSDQLRRISYRSANQVSLSCLVANGVQIPVSADEKAHLGRGAARSDWRISSGIDGADFAGADSAVTGPGISGRTNLAERGIGWAAA